MLNKFMHAVAITVVLSLLAQVGVSESIQPSVTLPLQSLTTQQLFAVPPSARVSVSSADH